MRLLKKSMLLEDIIHVDPLLLAKWNRPVPRYTSYPTAPQFYPLEPPRMECDEPISVYIHIPFCKTMCLFCGCSVILNRKPERQSAYLAHLIREIGLVPRHKVAQLHLGGGTPTSLSEGEFDVLMGALRGHFEVLPDAEVSIEIDPRTVFTDNGRKLEHLKTLGFNRVSFGVQDLDPLVQEAVKRHQTEEMTVQTYLKARELGFDGINIDLIYGLPHQTAERFEKTAEKLIALRPDRIAFYSYAKVPWLKSHQKAIPDELLPSTEEKFRIYVEARARFMEAGYAVIGMDHFALHDDSLVKAYVEKKLYRNFQGYSVQRAENMIGLGVTSIGFFNNCYLQNVKDLETYQARIAAGLLPVERGYILNGDDIRRRRAIQSWMCHFELDKGECDALADLRPLVAEGFVVQGGDKYVATPMGRLFIRLIASAFDSYIAKGTFSRAV